MAAGDTLQGRRLDSVHELWERGERGDYYLWEEDGKPAALWFRLPNSNENCHGRIAAQGHGQGGEPEWTIAVDPNTKAVTVAPSILQYAMPNIEAWHGFLEGGVWREV